MKWTALWSLMLSGAMLTSCGGDSGGGSVSSDRTRTVNPVTEISSGDSCTPLNSYFSELRTLTNAARAKVNAAPLSFSLQLGKSAQLFAKDMATNNYFAYDHIGRNGSKFNERIRDTGYQGSKIGENLAAGGYTAQQTFNDWFASDSHKNNLLSTSFTEVGFGMFDATGESTFGRYWVQHLGSGNSTGGIYIPNDCGLETLTAENVTPDAVVAGRSNLDEQSTSTHQAAQPTAAYGGETLTLPGNGSIPVGSLAFAVADTTRNSGNQEIPEPALLLGLGGLGLAIWKDRKVAARKASNLAISDSGDHHNTESAMDESEMEAGTELG